MDTVPSRQTVCIRRLSPMKRRVRDNVMDLAEALRALPGHQNSWIYMVDMESHELLLINNKTYKVTPDSKMGMSYHGIACYETAGENGRNEQSR